MHRLVRCGARSAPMGIPVTRECALPGCETLSSSTRAKDGGVYFDVSVLFAPREARKPPVGEVCAIADCCSNFAFLVRLVDLLFFQQLSKGVICSCGLAARRTRQRLSVRF